MPGLLPPTPAQQLNTLPNGQIGKQLAEFLAKKGLIEAYFFQYALTIIKPRHVDRKLRVKHTRPVGYSHYSGKDECLFIGDQFLLVYDHRVRKHAIGRLYDQ
jgi:hypothetical protein